MGALQQIASYIGVARVSLFPSLSQTEGFAHLNTAQKLVVEIAMNNDKGKQAEHGTILTRYPLCKTLSCGQVLAK